MALSDNELLRLKRDVRTLKGDNPNGGNAGKAITVPKTAYVQKSKTVTEAPTAEDYNLLVQDIAAIFKVLAGG